MIKAIELAESYNVAIKVFLRLEVRMDKVNARVKVRKDETLKVMARENQS